MNSSRPVQIYDAMCPLNTAKAAVVDPRYKRLKLFDEKARDETCAEIKEMEAIVNVNDVNEPDDESSEPSSKRAKFCALTVQL